MISFEVTNFYDTFAETKTKKMEQQKIIIRNPNVDLPSSMRGYMFERNGQILTKSTKLQGGIKEVFKFDLKETRSKYQTAYSSLFTQKKGEYYSAAEGIKITVIPIDEVYEHHQEAVEYLHLA